MLPLAPGTRDIEIPERIETERLILRCAAPGDGRAMNEAVLETWPTLQKWMPWAQAERPTVEESEENIERWRNTFIERRDLPMLIFLKSEPARYVGSTGLHRFDWTVPRVEIGYWVRASLEGQGFISESTKALTQFAKEKIKAERVEIHCSARNVRSQRVAERCGFALEATLKNHRRERDGSLGDTMIFIHMK